MGVVIQQSFKNTLILFFGFAIGGVNVLFLYTHFLEAEYYGLVTFLLSTANLIMPLLVFGMQHTIIKFFFSYAENRERDNFLLVALILPMLIIVPFAFMGSLFYEYIAEIISRENIIIKEYTYLIFLIAVFMGYFEVFYAWSKVQMKSVFGNFIREVFARVCVTFLLISVYLNWLSSEQFIYGIVLVYFFRMVIMKVYALSLYMPSFTFFKLPDNIKEIFSFSFYIILAGSAGNILLEIDKFMIPQIEDIAQVAYYSVGVYIASVIAIPSRAMQQITNPITAKELNNNNLNEVASLYKKSSLNLLIIGGLFFLLINVNIKELYLLINKPEYSVGVYVVLLISFAELIKLSLGTNGTILTNSKYFRMLFYFSIGMALSVIILNKVFITYFGIQGAAFATLFVVVLFSMIKVYYVRNKLKMHPYSKNTKKILLIIGVLFVMFYFVHLPINPLFSILIKSFLLVSIFVFLTVKLKLSEDINKLYHKYF